MDLATRRRIIVPDGESPTSMHEVSVRLVLFFTFRLVSLGGPWRTTQDDSAGLQGLLLGCSQLQVLTVVVILFLISLS